MLTFQELKERMSETMAEIEVMELLELTTEDLVERFSDKIEEKYDRIINQMED